MACSLIPMGLGLLPIGSKEVKAMRYLGLATAIAVTTLLGLSGLGVANEPEATPVASAVITQLVLRDHTVTLTSAPAGYLYTVTDSAGTVLNADLT